MTFEDWLSPQLPRLLRFATVLCGGPDLGAEVVQDVAIKAQARWSTMKDLEHPEAYLRRMIVNSTCLGDGSGRVSAALLRGTRRPEISATLGCSVGTVRSHASRALAALRVEMVSSLHHASTDLAVTESEEGSHAH